jgi:antitoxin (DNA-binding transcriptional repressor) of toxin-antitoxin stability system
MIFEPDRRITTFEDPEDPLKWRVRLHAGGVKARPEKELPDSVNHYMIHSIMKTATVRDLRTRFPVVQGWLAEGEEVAITKSGKRIAKLVKAGPVPAESSRAAFARRFGTPLSRPKKTTRLAQTLIDDRGP